MAPGARATQWTPKYVHVPGLVTPPGLSRSTRKKPAKYNSLPIPPPPPPGLDTYDGSDSWGAPNSHLAQGFTSVQISCLPNHLLSHAMIGATLEQAQLDKDVSHFVTRPGASRGEAIVTLTSAEAAECCTQHFHGRRWDASGIMVTAKVLGEEVSPSSSLDSDGYATHFSDEDPMANPLLDDLRLLAKYEKRIDKESGWDDRNLDTFGEESCDHDDLVCQVFGSVEVGTKKIWSMMSADAPVFVPGKPQIDACEESDKLGSDVSTEDGDSVSSCDEKDGAVAKV